MALGIKNEKLAILGALLGVGTTLLLSIISKALSFIPGVTADLQSISISTTGLSGVVGTGLGDIVAKLFTKVSFTVPSILYTAIGGALFVWLGAYILEMTGMTFKKKQTKLAAIFVLAGIAAGWIMAMAVSIPSITGIVVMGVNALILSYIVVFVDEQAGLNLV